MTIRHAHILKWALSVLLVENKSIQRDVGRDICCVISLSFKEGSDSGEQQCSDISSESKFSVAKIYMRVACANHFSSGNKVFVNTADELV